MSARRPLGNNAQPGKSTSRSMGRALAIPREADPLMNRMIRVTAGEHAARQGIVRRAFRGRVATPDRLLVEIEGGHPHRFVSIPAGAVEVLG
ncbi:hypothetical protein [Bosea sp. BK604]|uniref:hypothetical protein n=1 Tax=Bosea sp. BK604 TaxID=2512180 RepID=UPI00104B1B96|nr:hypothetical protein [Bosea sp. BK604]TCR63192.1 hypothetical protein EV560_109286 [Bosea sp. BK604]